MPDLNSLPKSSVTTRIIPTSPDASTMIRGHTPPSPSRSGSTSIATTSLQAAAAVNSGLQYEDSRRSSNGSLSGRSRQQGRRRSTVLMNLQLNDPSLPSPGEMINENQVSSYRTASPQSITGSPIIGTGDPHHNRAPSLGEIHQELEQEQEAQVNRLLNMIRTQQAQLQQLQVAAGQTATQPSVIDDSTPTSERSMSFQPSNLPPANLLSHSPSTQSRHNRSSFDFNRPRRDSLHRSRTPSRTASPQIRSTSISGEGGDWNLPPRDENAFYQAETQMLTRENQMLRMRIRELERQVNTETHANVAITHEPAMPSNLVGRSRSISEAENEGERSAGGDSAVKDD